MDEVDEPWGDFWLDGASDHLLWDTPEHSVHCDIQRRTAAKSGNFQGPGTVAMAMSFAIAHGLTWSALGDLTTLVNKIAGTEDPAAQQVYVSQTLVHKEE
ncbi:hypothetical protein HPB48_016813 [Haemaphysalis longicornis]|uniref:Uncharacterized protein n=1 Tax=Haemaphysalis longicornis TaxID=44386 RepID=A0A9J6GJZ0_HAELO|nr:hypothetical protein HPB48_016813 [Haemaphysalis longicornis]